MDTKKLQRMERLDCMKTKQHFHLLFVENDMEDVRNEPYNCFAYENEIYRNISDAVGKPVFYRQTGS